MNDHDPVKFKRETIEIEGGRKLCNYTFEISEDLESEKPEEPKKGNLKPMREATE